MKTFRRMYIYKESHLPAEGWLQGCFVCYAITGQCDVFSKKSSHRVVTEHVVYLCPHCKKMVERNEELKKEYEMKVNEYIELHS